MTLTIPMSAIVALLVGAGSANARDVTSVHLVSLKFTRFVLACNHSPLTPAYASAQDGSRAVKGSYRGWRAGGCGSAEGDRVCGGRPDRRRQPVRRRAGIRSLSRRMGHR